MNTVVTRSFTATALHVCAGVIVWALHFAAIYGITGLACARQAPAAALVGVPLATAVAVALLVPIVVRGVRRRARFESWLSAALGAFALVAVLWEALPVLIVGACA